MSTRETLPLATLVLVVLAAGAAAAQGYDTWGGRLPMPGYHQPKATFTPGGYQAPPAPSWRPLPGAAPPAGFRSNMAPGIPQAPGFKPFQGSSIYSNRGGLDAYGRPKAPRTGVRSVFGPQSDDTDE